MTIIIGIACLVASAAHAAPQAGSGHKVAACYGVYNALLEMSEVEKLSKDEVTNLTSRRDNAQAVALLLLDAEGVDEDAANDIIYGASSAMMDALNDTEAANGRDGVKDMHARAAPCDALLAD